MTELMMSFGLTLQVDISPAGEEEQESGPRLIPPPHHWSWYDRHFQ